MQRTPVMIDSPLSVRGLSAAGRALLIVAVCVALLHGPARADAAHYPTDEMAGRQLSTIDPTYDSAPDISAAAGILMDASGRALWSRSADQQRAMASTTKMMTALIALERSDPNEMVTISKRASEVSYAAGLRAGERVSVGRLLELALIASSNDAAIALAEHVSGSEARFVEVMNSRGHELGLHDTRFVNAHGLDAPLHHSSAADLASLSRAAMLSPEFRRIVLLKSITLPAYEDRPARLLKNTDELLGTYDGLLGIKTGFTDKAKYSFVASAERDGVTLTAVILGAPKNSTRFKHSARLLDWGFTHLTMQTVATTTETVGSVPVAQNPSRTVAVRFAEKTTLPVFDLDGPVTRVPLLDPTVALPINEGQLLGEVELRQGDRVLALVPVAAASDVASAEETVGAVPVSDYLDRTVAVRAAGGESEVATFNAELPVTRTVTLNPHVAAPVERGEVLGEITYTQAGRVIARVPAIGVVSVEAPGPLTRMGIWLARGWRSLVGGPRMANLQVIDG